MINRQSTFILGVLGTLFVLVIRQLHPPEFWITLGNYIGLYSLVAMGLVILTGVSGMTSFGQAAFVGIGAYASAYLSTACSMSPWAGLFLGLCVTIATAYFLGYITLGLSGHYLPLCTIAWGISLFYLFGNMEFLGKFDGITGIPPIDILGFELKSGLDSFSLIWCVIVWVGLALNNLLNSRTGRVLRALKGGVLMAESCGVPTMQYKLLVFVLAAVLAALSGWLYAHLQRAVNPTPFNLTAGIGYLIMAVVGGVGHLWGAVVGALLITVLNNWLQNILPSLLGQSGNYEVVVSGILLIFLLQKYPSGIWSWLTLTSSAVFARFNLSFRSESRLAASSSNVSGSQPLVTGLLNGVTGISEVTNQSDRFIKTSNSNIKLRNRTLTLQGEAILTVDDVHKSFGGVKAVNGVSFNLQAGQIVGLIGPNGAGKSTLFNLISGVLPVSSGSVRYLGQEVKDLPARKRAELGMARSFQHVRLISGMSVLDNVLIGAHLRGKSSWLGAIFKTNSTEEDALKELALCALEQVGLSGYSYLEATSLSLGQQRLLEIARAIVGEPNLLLLDEPAAGLRHLEKQQLQSTLMELSRKSGISILIVEHDMEFVMNMVDLLVVMDFGTHITTGVANEVRSNPRVIEAYLGSVD